MIHIRSILPLVFSLLFLAGCTKPQDAPSDANKSPAAGDDSKKSKASKDKLDKPDKAKRQLRRLRLS